MVIMGAIIPLNLNTKSKIIWIFYLDHDLIFINFALILRITFDYIYTRWRLLFSLHFDLIQKAEKVKTTFVKFSGFNFFLTPEIWSPFFLAQSSLRLPLYLYFLYG